MKPNTPPRLINDAIGWKNSNVNPPPKGQYLFVRKPGCIPFVASVFAEECQDGCFWDFDNGNSREQVSGTQWMEIPK